MFVPTTIVETVVPTMTVGTAVPTRVVGTTAREMIVPTMIVETAVPTIIVLMAYYWKSRVFDTLPKANSWLASTTCGFLSLNIAWEQHPGMTKEQPFIGS